MISRLTLLTSLTLLAATSLAPAMELKDIQYATRDAGKVTFSHRAHLGEKTRTTANLSCKACHGGRTKNRHYTMAEMDKGALCGACHNGTDAFPLARCSSCHKVREITYRIKATGPVAFSHAMHIRGMQCGACHDRLFRAGRNPVATMADMEKGKSCGACHNGKRTFSVGQCAKCHPFRETTFNVKDAGNVLFSHKFHTGLYGCGECHPGLYLPGKGNAKVSMAGMEAQKSCGACHDGKTAFTVKENCEKCHRAEKG